MEIKTIWNHHLVKYTNTPFREPNIKEVPKPPNNFHPHQKIIGSLAGSLSSGFFCWFLWKRPTMSSHDGLRSWAPSILQKTRVFGWLEGWGLLWCPKKTTRTVHWIQLKLKNSNKNQAFLRVNVDFDIPFLPPGLTLLGGNGNPSSHSTYRIMIQDEETKSLLHFWFQPVWDPGQMLSGHNVISVIFLPTR